MANVNNFQYIVASQPYSVYVNEVSPLRQFIVADFYIDSIATSTAPVLLGVVSVVTPSIGRNIKVVGY